MPLSAGKIERRETELSLGSYDSAVEDAQNPNPKLDELLKRANSMPPPKTSPKRPLEGPRHSPSPKKLAVEAPAEMAKDSPRPKGSQSEGSPGPSLSERSTPVPAPAPKAAKRGKSPTYWRPDLGYVSGDSIFKAPDRVLQAPPLLRAESLWCSEVLARSVGSLQDGERSYLCCMIGVWANAV